MKKYVERKENPKNPITYWGISSSNSIESDELLNFLKEKHGLIIDKDSITDFIVLPIDGSHVKFYAGRDALIVFNSVKRNKQNQIEEIEFSIYSAIEFNKKFKVLE